MVLLEAMLFEPYYPLGLEEDQKGDIKPSKKFRKLKGAINGYKRAMGDNYIDSFFSSDYYSRGYVKRLRKCYDNSLRELNEVLKTAISSLSVATIITIVTVATAGAFAPAIAVSLVGSKFAGLSGAALTSACLAYLGGGAIAAGGLGMAGGTMAIVGGGAILGLGVGIGGGSAIAYSGLHGKQGTIFQSAKLLVSVKEIFLNDEHDTMYSNSIYEKYVKNIIEIEKGLIELRLKADVANGKEKKEIKNKVKKAEESVKAMKIARKSLRRFISSFEEGLDYA